MRDGPDCRKLVNGSLRRWREIMPERLDKDIGDIKGSFRRFAHEAKDDLEFLCERGANPLALIHIIDTRLWSWGGVWLEMARDRDADSRQLLSPAFWGRLMKVLGKADESLSPLVSNEWVRVSAHMNPRCEPNALIPLSIHALRAGSAVSQLLHTARALGLDQPGWDLVSGAPRKFPRLVKTGHAVRGRPTEKDWGTCAATVYQYLMFSTGNPHWVSIARLLRAAGVKQFSRVIPREGKRGAIEDRDADHNYRVIYAGTVRKRIDWLRKDRNAWDEIWRLATACLFHFGRDGLIPLRPTKVFFTARGVGDKMQVKISTIPP